MIAEHKERYRDTALDLMADDMGEEEEEMSEETAQAEEKVEVETKEEQEAREEEKEETKTEEEARKEEKLVEHGRALQHALALSRGDKTALHLGAKEWKERKERKQADRDAEVPEGFAAMHNALMRDIEDREDVRQLHLGTL